MQYLRFGNEMILREIHKEVQRNPNVLTIVISYEPELGTTLDSQKLGSRFESPFRVEKSINPETWRLLKDADNESTIDFFYAYITDVYNATKALMEYEYRFSEEYLNSHNIESVDDLKDDPELLSMHDEANEVYGSDYPHPLDNWNSFIRRLVQADSGLPVEIVRASE